MGCDTLDSQATRPPFGWTRPVARLPLQREIIERWNGNCAHRGGTMTKESPKARMSGRETVVTFANAFGTTRSTLAIQRVLPMCLASHKLQQHSDTTPRSLFLVIGTHRAKIGDPEGISC